jgi:hypothetical protein
VSDGKACYLTKLHSDAASPVLQIRKKQKGGNNAFKDRLRVSDGAGNGIGVSCQKSQKCGQ